MFPKSSAAYLARVGLGYSLLFNYLKSVRRNYFLVHLHTGIKSEDVHWIFAGFKFKENLLYNNKKGQLSFSFPYKTGSWGEKHLNNLVHTWEYWVIKNDCRNHKPVILVPRHFGARLFYVHYLSWIDLFPEEPGFFLSIPQSNQP